MSVDAAEILLDDSDEAPPAARDELSDPRGRRKPGRKPRAASVRGGSSPSVGAKELASVLAKVIGGASVILALFLVGPAEAETVAMTPGEASAIGAPAARMLAKSPLAKRAAALAARGGDAVDLALALAAYAMRVYPIILMRQAQAAASQARPYVNPGQAAPVRQSNADTSAANGANRANGAGPDYASLAGAGYADPDAVKAGAYGNVNAAYRALAGN